MGKSYSSDLRVRIYGAIEDGVSRRAAARRFGVSASTSVRVAQRMSATGSAAPARQGRPPGGGKLAAYAAPLMRWVEENGDNPMLGGQACRQAWGCGSSGFVVEVPDQARLQR